MKDQEKLNLIFLGQYAVQLPFLVRLSTGNSLIPDVEAFLHQVTGVSDLDRHKPLFNSLEKLAAWGLALLSMDDYSSEALLANYPNYMNLIRTFSKTVEQSEVPVYSDKREIHIRESLQKAGAISDSIKIMINQSLNKASDALVMVKDASNVFWGKRTVGRASSGADKKLFICHSTLDKSLAVAISREVESVGVSTWRDDKDIGGGDSIPEEISKGLSTATHFAVILSSNSINRPWVKTELENAVMLRHSSGLPKIIPILLEGLKPLPPIANIKGIDFRQFQEGLESLFNSLGVEPADRFDLTTLFYFYRKSEKALEVLKWCSQADSFMPIDEECFEQLEEMERFFETVGLSQELNTPKRYVRTIVSYSENKTTPTFDEDFYTYENCAYAGISLARKIAYYGETMADILGRKV
ncbi:MAG: toll/interleukin-1 receptor domain-containing protein [bacterium]